MNADFKYDVTFSFAGEDRIYVEKVVECLKNKGVQVFYDKYEEADLWGKDLYEHLDNVYKNKAKFCVMFISKYYADKVWTTHERKSAQERAFNEKGKEYILPARFDNTVIPGIRDTVHYVDLSKKTPEQLCNLILEKLGLSKTEAKEPTKGHDFKIVLPNVKRRFSDLEKKQFLEDSFNYLEEYFKIALTELEKTYDFIKTEFELITKSKFVVRIYYYGEIKTVCKIWMGKGMTHDNSISYFENTREIDVNNDNTMNDEAVIEDDGYTLYFHALMSAFSTTAEGFNTSTLPKEQLAKYFWQRFTFYLQN